MAKFLPNRRIKWNRRPGKKAIFRYKNHPSIILIKNKITVPELICFYFYTLICFCFYLFAFAFTVSDIEKELSNSTRKIKYVYEYKGGFTLGRI